MQASTEGRKHTNRSTYALVFLVLVIVTAAEVGLTTLGLPQGSLTVLFLALSLVKAALVAGFYMHLRDDPPVYTYIFVLPAIMLAAFVFMASLY
ncbi:MAG TPA: cytochrome C oxidase subunit IV family protein [Anaerolineales bacterium]|jgi:cytochrome c oxidase subunit 4